MTAAPVGPDWTQGGEQIRYQRCRRCSSVWYFRRTFCPHCGESGPLDQRAAGSGTVYAVTLVSRAPSEELRAHTPYLIALVDMDEGFRMMAHGAKVLAIGNRVQARFVTLGGRVVPFFEVIGP
jgi:uncharacterized OB-fold protein